MLFRSLAQHVYGMKLGRPLTSREAESAPEYLPFSRLDVYHGFKFTTIPLSDNAPERDAVKARPARGAQPARFDTAVVLQGEEAQASGMQGTLSASLNVLTDSQCQPRNTYRTSEGCISTSRDGTAIPSIGRDHGSTTAVGSRWTSCLRRMVFQAC